MELNVTQYTPVMSATPDYSAGDAIGTYFTIRPVPSSGQGIKLQSVTVTDIANQGPAFRILFFRTVPTGTYTDNAAMDLSAADGASIVGQVKIVAGDYETTDSYKIACLSNINHIMGAINGGALYAAIVADGVYNGASVADLTLQFGFEVYF